MNLQKLSLPFAELCDGLLPSPPSGFNPLITGVTADSRRIKPGYIFVALKGEHQDGITFIPSAVNAGAVAVICSPEQVKEVKLSGGAMVIPSGNPRYLLAKLAARLYVLQPDTVVGVTGTNGKTSVAYFYAQICQMLGYMSAAIGTIGVRSGDGARLSIPHEGLTTPEPEQLHEILAELATRGVTHAAMEASSHGLAQYRLHGVQLKAAAFTNLSHDHLDYHKTEKAYFDSKMKLFTEILPRDAAAVINMDTLFAPMVEKECVRCGHRLMRVGKQGVELVLKHIQVIGYQQKVTFGYNGKDYTVFLALVGEFQVSNVLCALGLVVASGIAFEDAIEVLSDLRSVPGRMQMVQGCPGNMMVVVDYAHTPDGLEKALKELKAVTGRKLWVVFGCGGDRDRTKRPEMGRIAATIADVVIVTDDNPRTEDPVSIRQAIIAACPGALEIGDRQQAVEYAILHAQVEDVILIAGKGHEDYQIIGTQKITCDDVLLAQNALKRKGAL